MNDEQQIIEPVPTLAGYKKIPTFKLWIANQFPYIETDFDAITNYELLQAVIKYLNTIIENENNVESNVTVLYNAFVNLHDYVVNYFDNLDVQEEINNKLDEMVEDGTLQEIVSSYLETRAIFAFDTVQAMKEATNLINGSYAETYGFYSLNDGGKAKYKVRTVTNNDVVNESNIIALHDNSLVAELIIDDNINLLQLGCKNNGSEDCAGKVQNALENILTENSTLYVPNGVYLFNSAIDMTNCQRRNIKGSFDMNYIDTITNKLLFNNCDGFINCNHNEFENLLITGNNETHQNRGFQGVRMKINKCNITFFEHGIYGRGIFTNNNISRCTIGITGMIDSRAINNTINACENHCIQLFAGCNDNTITNNRLEWSGGSGVSAYQCYHNIISNNIIDRNGNSGISINNCSKFTITGNMMRRNGASADLSGVNSNNMKIESSTYLTITGNITQTGTKNDDGTGDIVPAYAVYIVYSHDFIMSGNDFSGGNSGTIAKYQTGENITEINLGYNPLANMLIKNVNGNTSSGSLNMNFSVNEPTNNGYPVIAKIGIYYRKTDNSAGGYKEIIASIYKRYNSTFVVTLSDTTLVDNVVTLAGSYADGILRITATSTSTGYGLSANQYYVPN